MNLNTLERRVAALKAAYPSPPTFREFWKEWKHMDALSKSLYELALSCPELVEKDWESWPIISSYLKRLGVRADPFSLEDILENLESD